MGSYVKGNKNDRFRLGNQIPQGMQDAYKAIEADRKRREQPPEKELVYPLGIAEVVKRSGQEFLRFDFLGKNGLLNVILNYLPYPVAIRGEPTTPQRAVSYVLYREYPSKGFLIRQSGSKCLGQGQTILVPDFRELYSVQWINEEAKLELNAIQEAFKQRKERIAEHLGIELFI